MDLKNKVVLITGSSSGIGEATAYQFAKKGARLVINCLENEEGAKKVVDKVKEMGSDAIYFKADVSIAGDVEAMFAGTLEKFGTIDVLINNAGSVDKVAFRDAKTEDWIKVFNNNLFGTMLCSQKALQIMEKNKSGVILNTSSIRGLVHGGREGIMAYSAAKAGVSSFTSTLAKLVAPGIRVNAVAPGFVWTPNYEKNSKELNDSFVNASLLKRWIDVSEIAKTFVFLAENDAMTGEVITVDAGWNLKF